MAKQRRTRPKATPASKKPRSRAGARRAKRPAIPAVVSVLDTKRTKYLEAVRFYEKGLDALQRRNFQSAAEAFHTVLAGYPDERELHERARLYLKVCEREAITTAPAPQSSEELVYAATLALNSGDQNTSLRYLQSAVEQSPDDDRVHYLLAVAYAQKADNVQTLTHLRRAIEIGPENRSIARQESDFDAMRTHEEFRRLLEPPPTPAGRRRIRRSAR